MAAESRADRNGSALGRALLHDSEGRWAEAHAIVAAADGPLAAWLHAYLHRREGDLENARYWYARAGQKIRTGALADERHELAAAIAAASHDRLR